MRRASTPPDLRLIPPVLAGWAGTWAGLTLPPRLSVPLAGGAAGCAVIGFVLAGRRAAAHPLDPEPLAVPICAALLVSAGLALAAAAHLVAAHRGPLPDLAARGAQVDATVTVTGDPRHLEQPAAGSDGAIAAVSQSRRRPDLELIPVRIDTVVVSTRTRAHRSPRPGRPRSTRPDSEPRDQGGSAADARCPPDPPGACPDSADAAYRLGQSATILARLRAPADLASWSRLLPSTTVSVHGRLAPARPGTIDAAVLFADTPPRVVGGPDLLQAAAGALRSDLRDAVSGLPAEPAGVLPALAVGDTSHVPAPLAADFKKTGLTYLTVVSGENLMFLSAALIPAARRIGLRGRGIAVFGILLTLGFTVLARPGPPMVRATVTALVGWAAVATGRRSRALTSMAAAVLALLLIDPWLAATYGFALSVAATAGLVVSAPGWHARLAERGLADWIAYPAAATAAAELYCEPLLVTFTGSLPLLAVPANILAVPAAPIATVSGVAAMAGDALWHPAGRLIAWFGQWPVRWICLVAHTGAAVPGASVGWPRGLTGLVVLLLCYVVVGWAIGRTVRRFRSTLV
jgi:ComEC/Rec2-related protein